MEHLTTLGKRLKAARLGALERVGCQYSQQQIGDAVGDMMKLLILLPIIWGLIGAALYIVWWFLSGAL